MREESAALAAVALASFLTPLISAATNVAIPSIGEEFGVGAILLSWITTAHLLTTAALLVPLGRAADIWGRKKVFLWGLLIYAASSLLAMASPSAISLIAARAVQGAASAMIFATGVAIISSVFPPRSRGWALGVNAASIYVGLSLGPLLGGVLTQWVSWRSIFALGAVVGFASSAVALFGVRGEWVEARGEAFDWVGSALYCAMLTSTIYGFSQIPSPTGFWLCAAGIVLLVAFVAWERRARSPMLELGLFRYNRMFACSNLTALALYAATFATGFLLSLYLQWVRNLAPALVGLILVSRPAVQALFSPLAGWISDRAEPRTVVSAGVALSAAGLWALSTLAEDTGIGLVVAALLAIGLGIAFFSSPNTNAAVASVDKRFYGVASATLSTMRAAGQTLSMGVVMVVFSAYLGDSAKSSPLFALAVRTSFSILTLICLLALAASLLRGRLAEARS